ncbi:MAG: sugar ABC transporter permease [Candidatus Eisenbacteria bacterium]|nr:sugar ABC transporter permease [Candidatus Eisenbacteria bacterium]
MPRIPGQMASAGIGLHRKAGARLLARRAVRRYELYLFLVPSVAYFAIFHYAPIYGLQLAFKDFLASRGIWGSPWVGPQHFKTFFSSYYFGSVVRNTVVLSLYQLVASFPFPILLALLLNEIRSLRFKRVVQTVTYAPHFISTVVMVGIVFLFLDPGYGVVNSMLRALGMESVDFVNKAAYFKSLYVWSGVWQQTGWASVVYFAVLASMDVEQHEAAIVDGATKLQRMWYINVPSLMPTAIILLILNSGYVMNIGFEKVYLMQNGLNIESSQVISTYVYRVGLLNARYSFSTAVGLFNSLINCATLLAVNKLAKRLSSMSLW